MLRRAIIVAGVVGFAAIGAATPGMFSGRNLVNLFSNVLPLLILTAGQTVVLIGGGIDLSVTAIMAMTSVCGAAVMTGGHSWLPGSLLMLAVGAALGAGNGLAVTRLGIPPFMVSLAGMMLFEGAAVWATQSRNIDRLPPSFTRFGGTFYAFCAAAFLVGIAHLLLRRSVWGRWLYAVGINARTSLVSGVPVQAVIISSYVVSGLFASAAAILYTARLETGSPVLGQRMFLDVIAAAVIGGASLFGGRGNIPGILAGTVFVAALDNMLNLMGLSFSAILMTKGAVILVATALDMVRTQAWKAA